MSKSGSGSVILSILLGMTGWFAVTLYNSEDRLDLRVQALDLRLTKLEATQYIPDKPSVSTLLLLSSEVHELEMEHAGFRESTEDSIDDLDRRMDMLIMERFPIDK